MEKSYDYALSMTILADEVYDDGDLNDVFGEKVFKIFDLAGNATYWYCIYVRLPEKTYAAYVLTEISRETYIKKSKELQKISDDTSVELFFPMKDGSLLQNDYFAYKILSGYSFVRYTMAQAVAHKVSAKYVSRQYNLCVTLHAKEVIHLRTSGGVDDFMFILTGSDGKDTYWFIRYWMTAEIYHSCDIREWSEKNYRMFRDFYQAQDVPICDEQDIAFSISVKDGELAPTLHYHLHVMSECSPVQDAFAKAQAEYWQIFEGRVPTVLSTLNPEKYKYAEWICEINGWTILNHHGLV